MSEPTREQVVGRALDEIVAVKKENAKLVAQLAAWERNAKEVRQRIDALNKRIMEYENAEASVCPEDVGFVEFIGVLQKRVAELTTRCVTTPRLGIVCGHSLSVHCQADSDPTRFYCTQCQCEEYKPSSTNDVAALKARTLREAADKMEAKLYNSENYVVHADWLRAEADALEGKCSSQTS